MTHALKRAILPALIMVFALIAGCSSSDAETDKTTDASKKMSIDSVAEKDRGIATFAGGCFWCVEGDLAKVEGVLEVISGYTGGTTENPTYHEVSTGTTGHYEAVRVIYDKTRLDYNELLDEFWRHVDPTDPDGQFVDRGPQYRTAIFYHDEEQKRLAEASKKALDQSDRYDKPVITPILPAEPFYEAEAYHQDYCLKEPGNYKRYRSGSGRDQFIEQVWGQDKAEYSRPSDEELRKRLSPQQCQVVLGNGTEAPFNNEYWDNKEPGIYVDVVSGEPLFSSLDKFDSGTGWPSYTRPLELGNIVERNDDSHGMERVEVRSRHGDSHLGHVFNDGPSSTGLRYCINSAALRFIPLKDLEKEGYGQYLHLFEDQAN